MKYHQTEDFKQLQKEWYDKLKQIGFRDIEVTVGTEQKLMQYSTGLRLVDNDKLAYYQALTYFVFTEQFDNDTDRLVLTRRADGVKIKDISAEMRHMGLKHFHRESIRYIIRRYEVRWGLKTYKPSQMCFRREKNGNG